MIRRIVEYNISCDNPDCIDGGATSAYGWWTRAEAIDEAPKHGWVRLSRGRWLCKRCAEKLLSRPGGILFEWGQQHEQTHS